MTTEKQATILVWTIVVILILGITIPNWYNDLQNRHQKKQIEQLQKQIDSLRSPYMQDTIIMDTLIKPQGQ